MESFTEQLIQSATSQIHIIRQMNFTEMAQFFQFKRLLEQVATFM